MHKLILVLGSNYEAEQNIKMAEEKLKEFFPAIIFTHCLRTEAINDDPNIQLNGFINQAAMSYTTKSLDDIRIITKNIEDTLQRDRNNKCKVTIDIDILLYDEEIFKPSDWKRDYVKKLIEELNYFV